MAGASAAAVSAGQTAGQAEAAGKGPGRQKRALLAGAALFLLCAAGGFAAVQVLMPDAGARTADVPATTEPPLQIGKFVAMEPLTVNLGPEAGGRILRFRAELEVEPAMEGEVTAAMPRIMDVLNGYLRAVEVADLQDRSALVRLRAQMLHRIQMVTGPGRVRDLLVMEFVLN